VSSEPIRLQGIGVGRLTWRRGTPEEQEELLKGKDAQKAVSAAKQAARRIMQRAEILVPQVDAQPPAYAIPSPTAAESSKGSGFLAGLTETFHALTAAMRPKPEPFVVPLCQAALRGDLGQIKGLLAHGVNVNGLNEDGSTALICAAKASQHATARFLIANGADVSTRDRQGFPPLFRATETGDLEMISLLIDLGADPNEHGDPSQPFFVDVAAKSPLPVVNLLLDRGADVHTRTIYGTSIFVNAVKAENIPLIKLLARRGADVRSKDLYGDSPLTIAVLSNSDTSMELAQFFLDHGAKATLRAHDGRLLVVIAIENGRLDLAELLLGRGADPNSKTQSGERVLVKALKQGSLPMAKLFADRGADLNFTSRFGGSESLTPLMYAITRDQWDMAELIVRRGGNANTPDKKGRTPLLESLQKDHARMVSLLLQHGADLNQEGVMTPAAFARISGRHDFVELLRSRGSRGLAADPFVEPSQAGSSRPGPPSPNHPPNDGEAPPDYHSATRSSA